MKKILNEYRMNPMYLLCFQGGALVRRESVASRLDLSHERVQDYVYHIDKVFAQQGCIKLAELVELLREQMSSVLLTPVQVIVNTMVKAGLLERAKTPLTKEHGYQLTAFGTLCNFVQS